MNRPERNIRLDGHVGLGLIISWPTGVQYTNQTMGNHCAQQSAEGVFVSLRNDCLVKGNELESPENDLRAYFMGPRHGGVGAPDGLDDQDADFIERVFQKYNLTRSLRIDRRRLSESNEAWVHVEVLGDQDPQIADFVGFEPYPRPGVLIWTNSD